MKRGDFLPAMTLKGAFEQFLEGSTFARRTRESYAEDLAPLFAACGQAPITALTAEVVRRFLRAKNPSRLPPTIGVWLHCAVSSGGSALRGGRSRISWRRWNENRKGNGRLAR